MNSPFGGVALPQRDVGRALPVGLDGETNPTCPVCTTRRGLKRRRDLTLCPECGHIFQTDLKVSASYDAEYAHQYDSRPVAAMSELRWNFIQSYLDLPAGSKVLDIGYGNGAFLKHARAHGMEIFGIDVHREDFGVPVVDLDTPLAYDLVCFFDSLEHFPDFADLFRIRSHHVVVSVPRTPEFILHAAHEWRHYKPGEHLHYFSRLSLDVLMRRWGAFFRIADGHPEDCIRGRFVRNGTQFDNIYTAIYSRRHGVGSNIEPTAP